MTQQEQREYEWETGQQLLDSTTTARDLLLHNSNVSHMQERGRDSVIDNMVRGLADKVRTNQDTSGRFKFAMRLHARWYPPKLRNAAVQSILTKYEE